MLGKRKVTEKVLEKMKNPKGDGLTYQMIARKLGLSLPTVAEYLRKGRLEDRKKKAGSLEKLMLKMKKWEPVRRRATQNEVSVDKIGIDIFAWAAGHFKGYKGADLYVDDETSLLGIKPVAKGQRRLISKAEGRGFFISCIALMGQAGVNERKKAHRWIGAVLKMADVVKLNEEEIRFVFGSGVEEGAEKLLEYSDRVFISLGKHGCYYADEDSKGYFSSYKVEVRDTTGAGDGFMGGVIYGTLKGWGVEKTASFSNAVGALTASRLGGIPSMPTLDDVLRLIQRE